MQVFCQNSNTSVTSKTTYNYALAPACVSQAHAQLAFIRRFPNFGKCCDSGLDRGPGHYRWNKVFRWQGLVFSVHKADFLIQAVEKQCFLTSKRPKKVNLKIGSLPHSERVKCLLHVAKPSY